MSANDQEITKEYLEALLADFDYKTDIDSNSDLFFDNNVIKDDDPVRYFLEQIKRLSARIMHETCSIASYVYLQHCVYEVPSDNIPAHSEDDRAYIRLLTEYFDKHDQWGIIIE